jgi:predicted DNA-binding protein (MmcQ/YjbR family)
MYSIVGFIKQESKQLKMNIEDLRDFALSLPGVTEGFPFGESTLVFKIRNKIFLLASLDANPLQFNVKCDPENAVVLRERYECILPGYHMNKKHWNTILIDGTLTNDQLKEQISNSYNLVAKNKLAG